MHHDVSGLGLICLVDERKVLIKLNSVLDFLRKRAPSFVHKMFCTPQNLIQPDAVYCFLLRVKRGSFYIICYIIHTKVMIEGVVGGYHGDIAISDVVLGVNDSCSFTPKKALVLPVGTCV